MNSPAQAPESSWLNSLWTFWVGVAVAGPLALPLLWRNPTISRKNKILLTIATGLLTAALIALSGKMLGNTLDQFRALQETLKEAR